MKRLTILGMFGLAMLLAGCGDDTPEPPTGSQTSPPPSDVIPAQVQQLMEYYTLPEDGSAPNGDPVLKNVSPDVPPYPFDTSYDVYSVTFLWGDLVNFSPNPLPPTDWSGTLAFNGEATVNVTHTIDFEPRQDSVILTDSPALAAWVSATNGDFDGLSFLVFVKRGIVYFAEPSLTFTTPPFTLDLPQSKMAHFQAFYHVSNTSGVAVFSRQIKPIVCENGFMVGEWIRDDISGLTGTFSGIWQNANGDTAGVFSGRFWTTINGHRVFEGNVSGYYTDHIIAFLGGTWYYDDPRLCPLCGSSHGRFKGGFVYADRRGAGQIEGEFGDLTLPPEQNNLPLKGTWQQHCPYFYYNTTMPVDL